MDKELEGIKEEWEWRLIYQRSIRILREIPSTTPVSQLTLEQRAARRDHDAAIAWLTKHAAS